MLFSYFIEIKNRSILLFISWVSTFYICYLYKEILLFVFIKPSLILYKINNLYFITTNITEIFSTYINLASFISNQIFFLHFLYHLINFIFPGLYIIEKNNLKQIIFIFLVFWIFSIIFLYYIIFPFSWNFFFNFQQNISNNQLHLYFEAKLSEYLNFFMFLLKLSTLNCQIFTILFIYINNIKNNLNIIKKYKKFIYLFIFFTATLLTPPDVFSQLFLGMFMVFFYEIFIILIIFKNIKFNKATN
jgi:sec-independent protein translocase protein TatC